MKKVYKTAKGRPIDIEALKLKNDSAVALGNMKVNARGDKLGKGGKIIQSSHERTTSYYEDNPKAVKKSNVSLKDAADELNENLENVPDEKPKAKPKAKAKKNPNEKELQDGSIEIVDPDKDEGNNL